LPIFSSDPASDFILRGKAAAQQALRLDDSLGEAHASLALALEHEWDFSGAEREFLRALELNPGYATAHQWYGEFLSMMNRMDEALEQYRLAMKLDPLSSVIRMEAALPYHYRGQNDEAIHRLRDSLKIDPSFAVTYGQLGCILSDEGNQEEALREFQQAVKYGLGDAPWIKAGMAVAYARSGNKRQAHVYLAQLQSLARRSNLLGPERGGVFLALGEKDQAIQWFQRAYRQHDWELTGIGIAPAAVPLRGDPRMQELVHRMGLPPSVTASWNLPSHSSKL
jgi:tetratricopeptide (TPR) repeat protein